jgi:cyclohexa-1,5-dienecarbonyl-CoA hydratase
VTYRNLRFEPGPAARLVLDRPPVNVLTIAMLEELAGAVEEAAGHRETRALVLTGAGKSFCAGVDVADHTADRVEAMIHAFARAVGAILAVELPVVAVLNGAALGGGLELALACDLVVARAGAKLGQPEIRLGVFPPAAAALLPRRVGLQRALDLVLTGRTVTAEEAAEMGLVARVFPAEELEAGAAEYTARLTGFSRPVLALAKRAVLDGLERPLADALDHADRLYLEDLMQLDDPHEGLAAFTEKRMPVWSDS